MMRDEIQELANVGTADVSTITPIVIASVIEEISRHNRVFAPLYRENNDLANGTGGDRIPFPKKGSGMTATFNLAEATGVSTSKMKYSAVTIAIAKGGMGIGFTGEAIRNANRDVIRDALTEAGEVWADTLDLVALEAMFPTATASSVGAATNAASLFIGLKSVTAGAATSASIITTQASGSTVVFTAGATFSYWYVPTTNANGETIGLETITAQTGSITAKDLLTAKALFEATPGYSPTVMFMHPDRLTEVLYDASVKFLEKSVYKDAGEVYTGELGKIWGIKTVVSYKVPRYGVIFVDSNKLGYHLTRRPLKLTEDPYTGASADVLYYWGFAEENFGVVNAKAYGAVVISGTFSPVANPSAVYP
jgi:N4-gp56 family major capsid protein